MHDIRGYDSHLFIKQAFAISSWIGNRKIDEIPNSTDNFMACSIGDFKFSERLSFMASSLDSLVSKLSDKEDKLMNSTRMKSLFPIRRTSYAGRAYLYLYGIVDGVSKPDYGILPPKEVFLSTLTKAGPSHE